MLLGNQTALGQVKTDATKEFAKLNQAYHSGHLLAGQYFLKADSLTHQLLSEGKHFETKELVSLLELYEELAWSKDEYRRARISYYFLFFNNARIFKKKGASMYYAEKITAEYKKNGEEHPLVEQLQKCKIYQEQRLYNKVIELYKNEKNYLETLPLLLQRRVVDEAVGLNAMYILSPTLMGYIKMNDTAAVRQTAQLALQIGTAIQHKYPIKRSQMLYNDLLLIDIEHSVANFEHRYNDAKDLLNRMQNLKVTYKDQATNFIDINVARLRIENYLNLKNPDSLSAYIAKYESSPNFGQSQSADLDEYKAKLQHLKGDDKGAYAYLTDALKHERDLQASLMTESSDLLYAYTQAEHSHIALQKAEQIKQQRTFWLVLISIGASVLILTIYLIMVYRSRKARAQVEALNHAANMQVIAMEEVKYQAVREEQQRLGQDLHDGLSSSIAAFRNQLEVLSMDIEDIPLRNKFMALHVTMAQTYETVRNKSHEWFSADTQRELSFEKQIKMLTDGSLPDNRYQKTIHIDDSSLTGISTDTRISLLRIIQEAVTNIIKHAKAKSVEILIYEEAEHLILTVNDDGIGLAEKKSGKSNMGLESIRRRAKYLNGELKINSGTKGTEITISIPIVLA
ncbi:ATP-binding protein [Pedobacter sp. KR3-3]|uniref:histidine kinase n=1 Tax=Pedobacter albus TaxID=3113905 RepID=A0ABU7I701_9SPHI|nr:ATP-binding protein [Pedobacter sp. KR3-3]MEE1945252.1 ATP-binding protein [Pedobacter sp. KR3-3]